MSEGNIYIHIIEEGGGILNKCRVSNVPRSGDELRMGGAGNEIIYKITRVVWIYDEPECPFDRVNIGVELIES